MCVPVHDFPKDRNSESSLYVQEQTNDEAECVHSYKESPEVFSKIGWIKQFEPGQLRNHPREQDESDNSETCQLEAYDFVRELWSSLRIRMPFNS